MIESNACRENLPASSPNISAGEAIGRAQEGVSPAQPFSLTPPIKPGQPHQKHASPQFVLLRAACAASITGVFCSAQRARPQLRACFAPRSVRDPITGVFELKSRVILLSIEVWGAKNTRIPSLQPFWCGCPASVAMGFRPLERPYSHPSQMCSAPIDTISLRRRPSQHPILD